MSYFLSVVVCGRNDDYGRDYLKRLQTFVSGLDHFSATYGLSCQIVFVEWNPPANRPRIQSVVNWGRHLGVKVITVPGHVDARLPVNKGNSGLHEFVAKNVGVRRADGEYVLCCTSDLIFSPELVEHLARRELSADVVYRATRINVRALPEGVTPAEAPAVCRREVLHAEMIGGRCVLTPQGLEVLSQWNVLTAHGLNEGVRENFGFVNTHESLRLEVPLLRQFPELVHTNGAGDFTLISHVGWMKLGGYLENDCRNHVDAWFCYHAVRKGFAQVILPLRMCVYHQEHEAAALLPYAQTLARLGKLPQNPQWGLAEEKLETEVVQEGGGKHKGKPRGAVLSPGRLMQVGFASGDTRVAARTRAGHKHDGHSDPAGGTHPALPPSHRL
jgi:hypothetical protein